MVDKIRFLATLHAMKRLVALFAVLLVPVGCAGDIDPGFAIAQRASELVYTGIAVDDAIPAAATEFASRWPAFEVDTSGSGASYTLDGLTRWICPGAVLPIVVTNPCPVPANS